MVEAVYLNNQRKAYQHTTYYNVITFTIRDRYNNMPCLQKLNKCSGNKLTQCTTLLSNDHVQVKVKFSLYLTKHHKMKMCLLLN